jgi:hypothetical protein
VSAGFFFFSLPFRLPPPGVNPHACTFILQEFWIFRVPIKQKENPEKTPEKGLDYVRWRWWWRPCQKNALAKMKNLNHEWHTRLGCFIFLMQSPLKK